MKKSLLWSAVLVMTLLMTVGFAYAGGKAETPAEKEVEAIKLSVWWWGEQDAPGATEWLRETIELYQKDHPNVTIEEILQTTEGLVTTVATAIETQSGPDILTPWPGFDIILNSDSFYPLKDYVDPEVVDAAIATDATSYKGVVYGMPLYTAFEIWVYNKRMFKQVGIKNWDNFEPKTWQEILDACAKLKAAGITPVTMGMKDLFAADWVYGGWGFQFITEQDVLKCILGTQKYTEPKMYKWMEPLYDLARLGYLNDDILSVPLYQGQVEHFVNEKAAMGYIADVLLPDPVKKFGDDLGIFLMPVIGDGIYKDYIAVSSGGCWVITRWSPHPEEAGKFLSFVNSRERLNAFYEQTGSFPASTNFKPTTFSKKIDEKLWELKSSPKIAPYVSIMWPWEVQSLGTYLGPAQVLGGKMTPVEAAELIQEQLDKYRELNPDMLEVFTNWLEPLADYYIK